jgi:hypothetical protein
MLENAENQYVIVNSHTNDAWYPHGAMRLERTLVEQGSTAHHLFLSGFQSDSYDKSCPYNIKADALELAIIKGYRKIIWNDCSHYYTKSPNRIWDIINADGYFFWRSGWNCAQTSTDKQLEYFNISRDEAENIHECSSSIAGFDLDNPIANKVLEMWIQAAKDGLFKGSRNHDINDSQDPRFLFGRQDQSCLSLIMHKVGATFYDGSIVAYKEDKDQSEFTILMHGGVYEV